MTPLLVALALSGPLANPLPGGFVAGYAADTGLDIAGYLLPVRSIAAGTVEYAERGHTRWRGKADSPYSIRVRLDAPIPWRGRRITHAYYGHLSQLAVSKPEGSEGTLRVEAGELLGTSGFANGAPHLHLGLLLDDETSQDWGTYLVESEIREVLGGLRPKTRLGPGKWLSAAFGDASSRAASELSPSTWRRAAPPIFG